jgi:hypothetical protein
VGGVMGSSMGGMAGILGAMVGRIVYCREQHRFGVGRLTSPVQYCKMITLFVLLNRSG